MMDRTNPVKLAPCKCRLYHTFRFGPGSNVIYEVGKCHFVPSSSLLYCLQR